MPGQYQDGNEGAYGYQLPGASLNLPSCIAATRWSLANMGVPQWFGELACTQEGCRPRRCLPVTNGLVEMQQASTATCLCSDVSQSCGQSFSKSVEDTVMELRSPEVAHLGHITSEQLLLANKIDQTQGARPASLGPYMKLLTSRTALVNNSMLI